MIKLNSTLFRIKNIQYAAQLSRFLSTDFKENTKLSLRQKSWMDSQQRYENHQHIFYSSHLELQDEYMSYGLKRSIQNKIKKDLKRYRKEQKTLNCYSSDVPEDWMEDYEYYNETNGENGLLKENKYGTADPNIPASNVPCNGCGAILHCKHQTSPGFLPTEIFKGRTENELKSLTCQRCHFLKNYNVALDIEVTTESYIETISSIKDKYALAIVMVDLLDFPCSIWPGVHELLGSKRPVIIVGNKVDLLPRDSNSYLDHVKQCLTEEILKSGFDRLNVKHVSLISAKTGYGIEELITQLHKIWAYKGDVYLLGCTNVGKSSLFNILLNSDYCRPETSDLIRKATTCPWPGTTLKMLKFPIFRPSEIRIYERFKRLKSEKFIKAEEEKLRIESARKTGNITDAVPVGTIRRTFIKNIDDVDDAFAMSKGTQPITTFNERSKEYQKSRWVYDTPGVLHPEQITNLLTPQELGELQPKQMISPRSYRLKLGMSLFVGGLGRLDFIKSDSKDLDWVQIFLFASFDLPTMIVETEHALDVYKKYLNTPLMKVPMGDEERLRRWPGLQCSTEDLIVKGYVLKSKTKELNCSGDIILSSSGWVGIRAPVDVHCVFRAWTPHARGIFLRAPSLVPYAERIIGKRIRNSLAYNTTKPFVFKK
ncbi:nitric oxide-associated protein 1 [Lucilia sericata]|uniref:nitric oxide-associated protein 1 n=1 Tax=Lucilia sericata TaxID=13632 RepID=UPI0018A7EC1D|nr:nitric oxide-associated protein 1 [Lucilia sericata]